MRDDILRLPALMNATPPAVPVKAMPLPSTSSPGPSSFVNALQRATRARLPWGQPPGRYASPLAGPRNAPVAPRPKPPTLPAPPASLSTPPKASTTISLWRPPSRVPGSKPVSAAPIPAPAPLPAPIVVASPRATPLPLNGYPRPPRDNGRGMHWIPTTYQSPATVDRFVAEAQRMGVKWVTFLNDGASISDNNDYLVSKLVGAGIEPIMRCTCGTTSSGCRL